MNTYIELTLDEIEKIDEVVASIAKRIQQSFEARSADLSDDRIYHDMAREEVAEYIYEDSNNATWTIIPVDDG